MDLGLRGRAALVAASSRGMGLAIARQFAAEGADVGMCARDGAVLQEAADSVRAHGTRVWAVPADLSSPSAPASVVDRCAGELGRLDILVVNAGGPPPGDFADFDDAAWHAAVELTLMSAVRLVRAAVPHLQRSDAASILFVSSYSVRQPIPRLTLSNTLRTGVAGLAKTLTFELAPTIRVNTLLPGTIATQRSVQLAAAQASAGRTAADVMADVARTLPLRRYGTPEEFANVAVFISSPAAAYVTGTALAVDGGLVVGTL
jgi:3-oxoacyl-[acyl-carrier protein] reductase